MMILRRILAGLCLALLLAVPATGQTGRRVILFGKPLWTPLNLSSLVAWWDAQYTPNLTFNSSTISAIKDRSANGIVASQGTGANQPGWSATGLNSKPALSFSGNQTLAFSSALLPTSTSSGSLASAGVMISNGTNQRFVDYGSAGGFRGVIASSAGSVEAVSLNASVPAFSGTTSWTAQLFVVLTIANNSQALYANGTADGTAALALTSAGTSGLIGAKADGTTGFLNGQIQQIVVTNSILTTCQRQKLEGWESWYDGKAGSNLPSGHPYKTAAPTAGGAC